MERSYLPVIQGYVDRPRVDALIRRGLGYSLVLVVAGPGYGKTLSVARCLKDADIRLIWVRISGTRNHAADFWRDTVKASRRELPEYAQRLEKLEFPDTAGSFEQFIELTSETALAGERLVFVVDNYERILDEGVTQFLDNLIESELPNFTMFILCNAMLPFAEALPASGRLRITDENLAFTLDEAQMMFERYGAGTAPGIIERAVKVTGGWPLGLRLVCESHPDNPEFFSSHSPLQMTADLHDQYCFRNYPKDVQTQLVLLSQLPQFSFGMVGEGMETPRETFANILMQHPFISYDYASGLFLFQPMYHEFLRQKQNLLSVESRGRTLTFAARWFLEHGMTDEAMDCFWDSADYDGFMDAVYALPKVRHPSSSTNRVLQRLEHIPRSYADENLGVDYARAFMHLNAADTLRARELLLSVEKRLCAGPTTPEKRVMLGDIYSTLADIATFRGEDTGIGWMKKAYEMAPDGTRIHSPELLSLGNNSVFFLPGEEAGQLEHMVEYFFEYAKYADKVKNGCGHGYEYLFAGEAAFYREDMDSAAAMFNSAIMKAQRTGQHDIICNALWDLGRIELYYGNHKTALALLGEIESYVNDNQLTGMYELRDCFVAFFNIWLGDVDRVPAWFGETMSGPEPTPIAMARKQLIGAHYLFLKGERAKAYALVLQLEALLDGSGRWAECLSLYVLKAQHLLAVGKAQEFEAEFKRIYKMVYANDLKLCLSNYGREMVSMLDCLKRMGAGGYDWDWLDKVHEDSASTAKRQHVMRAAHKGGEHRRRSGVSLTEREDETLRFLAQGLTQKEIGKLMGISENAVKKHISKIYFKLGAVNRADAIHIATVNGLVDVINS